jgi:hypothetical protein
MINQDHSAFAGKVSIDDVMFGFCHFVLAVLVALATTRGGLFNNNARGLDPP